MDEDFNHLVMQCNNCNLKFNANELKIDPTKNALVCSNCLAFPGSKVMIIKDSPASPKKKTESRISSVVTPSQSLRPQQKMNLTSKTSVKNTVDQHKDIENIPAGYKKFKCQHCNYAFFRKEAWQGTCPYCSRNTVKSAK
jgi:Zn finger protein HypA/HybF involved in hydrogenase expression